MNFTMKYIEYDRTEITGDNAIVYYFAESEQSIEVDLHKYWMQNVPQTVDVQFDPPNEPMLVNMTYEEFLNEIEENNRVYIYDILREKLGKQIEII